MRNIIIAVCMLLAATSSYACDVCGGSGGGSEYFGILPWYQNHFAGIRYQYKSFTSRHLPLYEGDKGLVSQEKFSTTGIWARFNLNNRFQVFTALPYATYDQSKSGAVTNVSGVGDFTAMLSYQLINNGGERKNWKHLLQVAGGVKTPTGSFKKTSNTDPININMQPGSGSWDVPFNLSYTVRHKRTGISTEANYRVNTTNNSSYRFGNRFSSSVKLFQWTNLTQQSYVLPHVGVVYEASGQEVDGVEVNPYSGGNILLATAGAETYIRNIGVGLQIQKPLQQQMGGGRIDAHARITAQLSHKF